MKKMLLSLFIVALCGIITACSSKNKIKLAKPTYEIIDNSTREENRPNFVFGELDSKWEKDKDYTYFIGEDDNVDKTLCDKGASANATEKVVEQLSQEIKSSYAKVINSDNDNLDRKTSMALQHMIESKLGGVEGVAKYWELRNYKKELGADKNVKMYNCYRVVKVKKSTIQEISDSVSNATVRVNDNKR